MLGRHMIKSWSSTQPGVTLSSGEAELCGVIRGSGMGLGFQSLMKDLGQEMPIRVWTDSSAAIGICTRQGLGKLRHIDTHLLWIQQAVRSGRVDLRKILGEKNPADLFTKHLSSRERVQMLVGLLGCRYTCGRAESAPLRRTGVQAGKVTMAETNSLEEERDHHPHGLRPVMPHLEHPNREEMNDQYLPIVAAEELDDQGELGNDDGDVIYQHGLDIVEGIRQKLVTDGRRRRVVVGE